MRTELSLNAVRSRHRWLVSECDRKTLPHCGTRNRKCSTAVCGQSVTWDHKCVLLSRPKALPWHDSADLLTYLEQRLSPRAADAIKPIKTGRHHSIQRNESDSWINNVRPLRIKWSRCWSRSPKSSINPFGSVGIQPSTDFYPPFAGHVPPPKNTVADIWLRLGLGFRLIGLSFKVESRIIVRIWGQGYGQEAQTVIQYR